MSRRSKLSKVPLDVAEQIAAARYGRLLTALARDLDVTQVEITVASGVHRFTVANHFDGLVRPSPGMVRLHADALALLAGRPESYADAIVERLSVAASGALAPDRPVHSDEDVERRLKALPLDARLLRAVRLGRGAEVDKVTRMLRRECRQGSFQAQV